ncbi:DUF805 domain-containing protein [Lacticaseibacillus saniviri]
MKNKRMSWGSAIKEYVTRAFDFKGRSSRAAYWWALFTFAIVVSPIIILTDVFNYSWNGWLEMVRFFFSLIVLVPTFSLTVRRYRDVGMRPGYAYVIHGGQVVISLTTNVMSASMFHRFVFLNWIVAVLAIIEFIIVLRPSAQVDQS